MVSMGRPSLPLPRSLQTSGRRSTLPCSADEAWAVVAGAHGHRLVLKAAVRAPGRVLLELRVDGRPDGCEVDLTITFEPDGLLGSAYLLADVGAREAVVELTHRRLLADLRDL